VEPDQLQSLSAVKILGRLTLLELFLQVENFCILDIKLFKQFSIVLASAAAPSGGGAGLGRDRYPGGRCGAVEGAWPSEGRRPATLGGRVVAPGTLDSLGGVAGCSARRESRVGPTLQGSPNRARGTDSPCASGY
jgi:hypothetical protein